MDNGVAHSRTHATSLLKGLRLLGLFSRDKQEWRVGEMSAAIGTAKSTVSRIAHTLESEGYLVKLRHKDGYRLGLRLWELGSLAIYDHSEFPQRVLPYLEDLVTQVKASVHGAILDEPDVVYVQKVDAMQLLRSSIPLGARFPTHCTATGKALLAFQPEEVIERVMRRGLKAHTERTITRPALFREELERVRKRGYALNKGEWRTDIGGIAAPVYDRTGRVIGAIGVTMPLAHYPRDIASPIADALVSAAQRLSQDLGFMPGGMTAASGSRRPGRKQLIAGSAEGRATSQRR